MTHNNIDKNAPRPRLCHLRRRPDFVGYGFNLHCERAKPGQFIGKVDPDSPAESAGLRENDRIIEVNLVPIGSENHKQVVARIKEGAPRNGRKYPEEVILLVLDQEADEYYKSKSYVVRSSDPNVEKLDTDIQDDSDDGSDSPRSSNRSIGKTDSHSAREPSPPITPKQSNQDHRNVQNSTSPAVRYTTNTSSPAISRASDPDYEPVQEHGTYHQPSPPISNSGTHREFPANNNSSAKPPSTQNSYTANGSKGIINLDMSAAEYREKLKAQSTRKRDPRQSQQMSMKEKRDFIDRL